MKKLEDKMLPTTSTFKQYYISNYNKQKPEVKLLRKIMIKSIIIPRITLLESEKETLIQ